MASNRTLRIRGCQGRVSIYARPLHEQNPVTGLLRRRRKTETPVSALGHIGVAVRVGLITKGNKTVTNP